METLKAIYSRRTTRNYNKKPATDEQLNTILKAALAAPVGGGKFDSVHITVIKNKDFLERWEEEAARQINKPGIHPLYGAPTLILISGPIEGTPMDNPVYSNGAGIVENMTLAAVDMGLGATHIWGIVGALNQAPDLLAELNIPDGFTPTCGMAVGCIDEPYQEREISEDKMKIVFFE